MTFPSIRIEGAILSGELLSRLDSADYRGQKAADFGFDSPSRLKEEIVRAWTDAHAFWKAFQRRVETLKEGATGATETRNQWAIPLLGLLGYSELEYQQQAELIGDKPFRISHRLRSHGGFPIHIVGARESLDRKPQGGSGPRVSPHAHVQEYLNLKGVLFALVTNGRLLRLLRDSTRLVKLSYVEFDLDRIFGEELFADFAVLYRLLQVSRLPKSPDLAAESLLERYHQDALESGTRIRDGLRVAVEQAIRELGTGFLARTPALQAAVAAGTLAPRNFYHGLLRLIYRLLFLMTAEERGLLFPRDADPRKRRIYEAHYSLARLRRLAERRHMVEPGKGDLWLGLCSTFRLFVEESAGSPLGLTALCGHLFSSDSLGPLRDAALDNATLLSALAPLSVFRDRETGQRVRVNYGALATEEFGSVYESLLELHPVLLDGTPPSFTFKQAAGNERKTTGSYYTPSSLVECLLDSALDPVVEQRIAGKKGADAERAILSLNVCDPAVGSGHFLIAAGHRLARRLATIRAGDDEPSPDQLRHALREVIGNCLYGVDVNPMSVELCKVTLWLEATKPGKPLSFLDHHIQCGNSLLGATPRVITDGLPDDAFRPLTGDDKAVCAEAKKRNKSERQQLVLFHGTETKPREHLGNLPTAMIEVETMSDDTAAGLHRKENRYAELVRSPSYENARFLADAWCAAFVWKKTRDLPYPITNDVLRKIERNPDDCAPWMREEIERLRDLYQFFHWHLAFPEVFPVPEKSERPANYEAGWNGGFDVMLGNPPWEKVNLKEQEWFSEKNPDIANAPNSAARKRLIARLVVESPALHQAFTDAVRQSEGDSHFLRSSELYPLCGRGDINLYAVFAESLRLHLVTLGRMGAVLPSGIATDDTTKLFFQSVVDSGSLISLFDFENRNAIFPGVHRSYKFCLLTTGGNNSPSSEAAEFVFFAYGVEDLKDPDRRFTLTRTEIALLNPNSRTCPVLRSRRDAAIISSIYRKHGVILRYGAPADNPWNLSFGRLFHMTDDAALFKTRDQLETEGAVLRGNAFDLNAQEFLPLYEGRYGHQFNHRFAGWQGAEIVEFSPEMLADSSLVIVPEYWVSRHDAEQFLERRTHKCRTGLLGYRRVSCNTNERTAIATVLPWGAASYGWIMSFGVSAHDALVLSASYNSFVFDYVLRNFLSQPSIPQGTFEQVALPGPEVYAEPCAWAGQPAVTLRDWLLPRVLELTYTAWDLEPFARDSGWFGPPFVWDGARRFQLRCELDAAFFHLYGLGAEDTAYILDTFPIVRRKDEAAHGTFRTKDRILEHYDRMQVAIRSHQRFQPGLDPIGASFRACHPPRLPQSTRTPFAGAEKYLLVFFDSFVRHTREEASLDLLDAVFHLLRHRDSRKAEIAATLGDDVEAWLAGFNDSLPNDAFLPFLKRLEADGWVTIGRGDGKIGVTARFPEVPFDEWRYYDVAAALHVIAQRPEVIEMVTSEKGASLSKCEFSSAKAV
jgi:hypothetical protein